MQENLINKRSTSKMAIKYVINRHGFCYIIIRISPQKTSISPSQARGDMSDYKPLLIAHWSKSKKSHCFYHYFINMCIFFPVNYYFGVIYQH